MEELLRKIKGEMEMFKYNAEKAIGGTKVCGARSRKASLALDKLLKEWRKVSVK